MLSKVSLEELVKTGAHFGHQSKRWNPKMEPFLFGVKDGTHFFDLTKTKELLEEALKFLEKSAKEGKRILFVGTKKQCKAKIEEVAKKVGEFYVNERFLGGTLTNFEQIVRSTKKLSEMKNKLAFGEYKGYTKKEKLLVEKEIARMERFFGGIVGIEKVPDIMVVVDIKKESGAVKEASVKGVTTVAIVDSNCDPTLVDYPIPMNDDATRAIGYVLDLMEKAIMKGKGVNNKQSVLVNKNKEE